MVYNNQRKVKHTCRRVYKVIKPCNEYAATDVVYLPIHMYIDTHTHAVLCCVLQQRSFINKN